MQYNLKKRNNNVDRELIEKICEELGISKIFAYILYCRGIKTLEEAYNFLNPSMENLNNPFLFNDMARSIEIIKEQVKDKNKICIYGDYDVDGVSGSAVLYKTLKKLNASVFCKLPSRSEHGYGLSMEAVESMSDFDLLITVDCGTTNMDEIARAKALGLKVIVTDHHECPAVLPNADCIINPKVSNENYPFKFLCGTGVVLKLSQALLGRKAYEYLDIAALATIADMVPLIGENRIIAKYGIKRMNNYPNLGLKCLINHVITKKNQVDSQKIAFLLAPRINAAGRIANANTAFKMLVTKNEKKADQLALKLCKLNEERQRRQEKVINEAIQMEEKDPSDKLILKSSKNWDIGIIGLGASKLAERYHKPAVLFGRQGDAWVGSARSIEGVNILETLRVKEDLYEKFGGHAGAAGLTVVGDYLNKIKVEANKYLNDNFDETIFTPTKLYDIELNLSDITVELINEFSKLEPYGFDNKPVSVLVKDTKIINIKSIGGNKHSRFTLSKNGYSIEAVAFRISAEEIPSYADIIGTLELNDYSNKPQFVVETFSFASNSSEIFNNALREVKGEVMPKEPESYYLSRTQMGEVYSLLKIISDKKYTFKNEDDFIAYFKNYIPKLDEKKLAFAISVFNELNLIAYRKDDKIIARIYKKKCNLDDSKIYKKYKNGVRLNEFKRKN